MPRIIPEIDVRICIVIITLLLGAFHKMLADDHSPIPEVPIVFGAVSEIVETAENVHYDDFVDGHPEYGVSDLGIYGLYLNEWGEWQIGFGYYGGYVSLEERPQLNGPDWLQLRSSYQEEASWQVRSWIEGYAENGTPIPDPSQLTHGHYSYVEGRIRREFSEVPYVRFRLPSTSSQQELIGMRIRLPRPDLTFYYPVSEKFYDAINLEYTDSVDLSYYASPERKEALQMLECRHLSDDFSQEYGLGHRGYYGNGGVVFSGIVNYMSLFPVVSRSYILDQDSIIFGDNADALYMSSEFIARMNATDVTDQVLTIFPSHDDAWCQNSVNFQDNIDELRLSAYDSTSPPWEVYHDSMFGSGRAYLERLPEHGISTNWNYEIDARLIRLDFVFSSSETALADDCLCDGQLPAQPGPLNCQRSCSAPNRFECHGSGMPLPTGLTTANNSIIDNIQFTHTHYAQDYRPADPSSCTSCSGGGAPGSGLPGLALHRIHRYADPQRGSLGAGVFHQVDARIDCYGTDVIELYDPLGQFPLTLHAAGNGRYAQTSHNAIAGLQLYADAAATTTAATPAAAVLAIATAHDGSQYRFELVNLVPEEPAYRSGRLISQRDNRGNGITVAYQHPATASDAALGHDRERLLAIATVTDAFGVQARYHYTRADGRLVVDRIEMPNGATVDYGYEPGGLIGVNTITYGPHEVARISAAWDAAAQELLLTYDDPGAEGTHRRKTVHLTGPVRLEGTGYDSQPTNRVRRVVNALDEEIYRNWIERDAATGNRRIHIVEGGQRLTRLTVAANGNPLRQERALEWSDTTPPASWVWEDEGAYATGGKNRVTQTTSSTGVVTEYELDPVTGQPLVVTLRDGPGGTVLAVTRTTYNAHALPTRVIDPDGVVTEWTYDTVHPTLIAERIAGRIWDEATQTVSDGPQVARWRWTYNARGQVLTATDPRGFTAAYEYNSSGLLIRRTDPPDVLGGPRGVTTYAYSAAGHLQSMTDPVGQTTRYEYDYRNRASRTVYADTSAEAFTWATPDDANILLKVQDRVGALVDFAYDRQGRRTGAALRGAPVNGQPGPVLRQESWTYVPGSLGQVATHRQDGGLTSFAYDAQRRLTGASVHPDADHVLTSARIYDEHGRVAVSTDAFGRRSIARYDQRGRLVRHLREAVPGGIPAGADLNTLPRDLGLDPPYRIEDLRYTPAGRLVERIDALGVVSRIRYDEQGRLAERWAAWATVAPDDPGALSLIADPTRQGRELVAYDLAGNPTTIFSPRHFDPAEAGPFRTEQTFSGRNLVLSRTSAAGRDEASSESFTYRRDGRLERHIDPSGAMRELLYQDCCSRLQAVLQPATSYESGQPAVRHAVFQNSDHAGRVTHEAILQDFDGECSCTGGADLPNAATLREVTRRYDGRGRLIAETVWLLPQGRIDPNNVPIATDPVQGLTTRYAYDEDLTDGHGLDAAYDLSGLPFAAATATSPALSGSAVEVTAADGAKRLAVSDALGRPLLVIDAQGGRTRFAYDQAVTVASATLIQSTVTDALGHAVHSQQDGYGLTRRSLDQLGAVSVVRYDARGRERAWSDPTGTSGSQSFDEVDRLLRVADGLDQATTFTYAAHAQATRVTDAAGFATQVLYDGRGLPMTVTHPDGQVVTTSYDAVGRVLSVQDNLGQILANTWRPNGTLAERRDALGHTSRQITDGRGLVQRSIDALGQETGFNYDLAGRLVTTTDALGRISRSELDPVGRVLASVRPDGARTAMDYTANGWLASVTDALGHSTSYTHDALGQRLSSTDALARTSGWDYDPRGLTLRSLRPDGEATAWTYDAAGRRLSETMPDGGVTRWEYDAQGRLAAVVDPLGNRTRSTYDTRNLLKDQTDALGGVLRFAYDPRGRLSTRTRADGLVLRYHYDTRGRLSQRQVPALGEDPGRTVDYDYDLLDRLESVADGTSSLAWTYDALGRPLSETQTAFGSAVSLGYGYDAVGNRTRLSTPVGDAIGSYDQNNRMTALTLPWGGAIGYEHDALDRPTRRTLPNGIVTETTYDEVGQLRALLHRQGEGGPLLAGFRYGYDQNGQRSSEEDARFGLTRNFHYDVNLRLTGVTTAASAPPWAPESFSYDRNGNPTHGGSLVNPRNQLTQNSDWSFHYQLDGGLSTQTASAETRSYSYDAEDRLVAARITRGAANDVETYRYDPLGRRIGIRTNGTWRRHLVDGSDPVLELDATNQITHQTILASIDRPILRHNAAGGTPHTESLLTDGQGSIAAVAGPSGTVLEHYRYSAYGTQQALDANGMPVTDKLLRQPYSYVGAQRDATTGLSYLRNRYLDPQLARFTQVDPAQAGSNWYAYAAQDPINLWDPLGLVIEANNVWEVNQRLLPMFGEFSLRSTPENSMNTAGKQQIRFAKAQETNAWDFMHLHLSRRDGQNIELGRKFWRAIMSSQIYTIDQVLDDKVVIDVGLKPINEVRDGTGSTNLVNGNRPILRQELPLKPKKAEAISGLDYHAAQLASDVYNKRDAPPGWERLADDNEFFGGLGPEYAGLYVALYKRKDAPIYSLAFRGTEGSVLDVSADITQAIGITTLQYERAIQLAKNVVSNLGQITRENTNQTAGMSELFFTGHSLGGGLAASAAAITGVSAVTFNSAGVHDATLRNHGASLKSDFKNIRNYRLCGEALTWSQEELDGFIALGLLAPDAIGQQYDIDPSRFSAIPNSTPILSNIDRHRMSNVLHAAHEFWLNGSRYLPLWDGGPSVDPTYTPE